jgi:subtilisin-like proprotein convertase family protein
MPARQPVKKCDRRNAKLLAVVLGGGNVLGAFWGGAPAHAVVYSLYTPPIPVTIGSGTTIGAPLWNRPTLAGTGLSTLGSSVPAVGNSFTAPSSLTYTFTISSSNPNYDFGAFLYSSSWNSAAPLTNLLTPGYSRPSLAPFSSPIVFRRGLSAGNYVLVNSGYENTPVSPAVNSGPYTTSVSYGGTLFNIPDNNSTGVAATLAVPDAGLVTAISSVTIRGLLHPYASDLRATLTKGATTIELFANSGGSADLLNSDLTFSPASPSFPTSGAIPAGTYGLQGANPNFSTLLNQPAFGDWTLNVSDLRGNDVGTFTGFSIDLTLGGPPEWKTNGSGNWTTSGNWVGNAAPNAPAATAYFGPVISSVATVTVGPAQTVGSVRFNNTSRYTLSGGQVRLDSGNASPALVTVEVGQHTINALGMTSDLGIVLAPGTSLTNAELLPTSTVKSLTVSGGGRFAVTTRMHVSTVSVVGTSLLDLQRASAVLTSMSESAVRALVAQFLSLGTGLGSTASGDPRDPYATLAVRSNLSSAGLLELSSFTGYSLSPTDILVKYTYRGDTNLDGLLDATDFNAVLSGLTNNLTGWQNGDVNYDDIVNATDWSLFLSAYANQGAPFGNDPAPAASIPEPTTLALLLPTFALLRRTRR